MAYRPARNRLPLRRLVFLSLCILLIVDFVGFRAHVRNLEPLSSDVQADAIVVLTGGSGLRIAEGMRLLEAGQADRLLITGVNRAVSASEVASRAGGPADLYECCVDIGYEAETTRGNALEAADWLQAHDFESALIVTSNYHVPRAMILLGEAMPDSQLMAAPVPTKIDPDKAFSEARSFRGLLIEWAKWRVTRLSATFR